MIIKKKADIKFFLVDFVDYADWDGNKYYLTVPLSNGTITILQYLNGDNTYYLKLDSYWSIKEYQASDKILWKYRKGINQVIKESTNKRFFSKRKVTQDKPVKR